MSNHLFGLHPGHLRPAADDIAERHGAWHVDYTEADGTRRGWFACRSLGHPFDAAVAKAVLADIEAAGGIDALRVADDDDDGADADGGDS
jgi:hypothetical protein